MGSARLTHEILRRYRRRMLNLRSRDRRTVQVVLGYVALPLALTTTVLLTTPLTDHNDGLDSDGVFYAAMAGMEGWSGPSPASFAPYGPSGSIDSTMSD